MRQYKFRVWDKKKKEMTYSGKARDEDDNIHKSVGFFFSCYCEKMDGGWCPTVEIMQFTGLLKDRKNQPIFEGDIVKRIGGIEPKFKVLWNNKRAEFVLQAYMETQRNMSDYTQDELEVIGNIYESPDLLTFEKTKGT